MKLPEFKTVPRAIAIDLDGTLLSSRIDISKRNLRAIDSCIRCGIPVSIATSRATRILRRIFSPQLASRISQITMSGAVAVGIPPLSGCFKETLSPDLCRSVITDSISFDKRIHITVETGGFEFGINWIPEAVQLWQRNSATPDMVLSIDQALNREPCKVAIGGLERDLTKLAQSLTQRFGSRLSIVQEASKTFLNVTSKTATKPNALRKSL